MKTGVTLGVAPSNDYAMGSATAEVSKNQPIEIDLKSRITEVIVTDHIT